MANWRYVFILPDGTLQCSPRATSNPFDYEYNICPGIHAGGSVRVCQHETFLQDLDEIPEVKSLIKVKTQEVRPPTTIEIDGVELFKLDPTTKQWYFKQGAGMSGWLTAGVTFGKLLDEVIKIAS